jgi:hypothetical protein
MSAIPIHTIIAIALSKWVIDCIDNTEGIFSRREYTLS